MSTKEKTKELSVTFAVDDVRVSGNPSPHYLICIHGIRDDGAWASKISVAHGKFQDKIIEPKLIGYSRTSIFQLFSGFGYTKTAQKIIFQITKVLDKIGDSPASIYCHSFGSKIVADAILREFPNRFDWIFLCGSICHKEDANNLYDVKKRIINEAATRDIWPLMAETIRPRRFNATGVNGFHREPVVDRFFSYKHGGALTYEHVEEWVLPVLSSGHVKRTAIEESIAKKHAPTYLRRAFFIVMIAIMLISLL